MDKHGLRHEYRSKRQKLGPTQAAALTQDITNNIWEVVDWASLHSIHSYLPIAKNNEVDTLPLLKTIRQINPDIKIATTNANHREAHWLNKDFHPGPKVREGFKYGAIIVPMMAFDDRGFRLGYGGGFYDRFLASQEQALIIGLCYEHGHRKKLPHDEYDIPITTIVTEKTVYKF